MTSSSDSERALDGAPLDEPPDPEVSVRDKALEALHRNRAWLGRELLTWLLWKSESGEPLTQVDGDEVGALFVGSVVLRGLAGEATELRAKGHHAAYAPIVRQAIARGLLVHEARLRIAYRDQVFEVTLDAENLSFRSGSLPRTASRDDDESLADRLTLVDELGRLVDALWDAFVEVRRSSEWLDREVPGLRSWLS